MIQIAICDDTESDIELLSRALVAYDPSLKMRTFRNGNLLIDALMDSEFNADILFLDIYMPGLDGIKTAEKIREIKKDVKIIFVSSSGEHYPQAYEVFAFNYILKPLSKERLYAIMDRAVEEIKRENHPKIRFSYKSTVYSVDCREIQYIESQDKLILFHLADKSTLQCYGKLDEIEKELPEQAFTRCHQSFIVNNACITEMGNNCFHVGEIVIYISKKYMKSAKDQYYTYIFSHMSRGHHYG